MAEEYVPVRVPYSVWQAFVAEYFNARPNLRLLYSAGWRSGFMVNGCKP